VTGNNTLVTRQKLVSGEAMVESEQLKLLVVDDSALYRRLVEHSVSHAHYALLFAEDGRRGLEIYLKEQPDLVITDWTMPDLSGPELCQQIRRTPRTSYCYIVLLTSHTEKEQVVEGLAAGADDYLTKPFHEGELLARLGVGRRIVELHRQVAAKNRQLEELALTDALTGLPNRRAIERWAARELSGAARHRYSVCFAIADLDNFKKINDTFGHDSGDLILRGFADVLRSNTRQSNLCGRLGGEEFLITFSHSTSENAAIALERIRGDFERKEFVTPKGIVRATASFGIAGFEGSVAPEFTDMLSRADGALYRAKGKGRNRIEIAELITTSQSPTLP
jgi:diguanylate cyclase (GGDEF)-like protein